MDKLTVKEESLFAYVGDMLMLPIMYILQGTIKEVPQRTHFWNNKKFTNSATKHLDSAQIITVDGDQNAVKRWWGFVPIFHMPILGGWKCYIVIEPAVPQDKWFVGWVVGDTMVGVSNIVLKNRVRLLKGANPAQFFGLNEHGEQIIIRVVGEGKVGLGGEFKNVPLL